MRIRVAGFRIGSTNIATGWPIFKCNLLQTHLIVSKFHIVLFISFLRVTWHLRYRRNEIRRIWMKKGLFLSRRILQIDFSDCRIYVFLLDYVKEDFGVVYDELRNTHSEVVD